MVLTKNLYSQVDSEGHTFAGLQEIIGHERDSTAVSSSDFQIGNLVLPQRDGNSRYHGKMEHLL